MNSDLIFGNLLCLGDRPAPHQRGEERMSVRRVYAEKKKGFRGAAESLAHEVRNYLGIPELKEIRILIRYDVENISDEVFREAEKCVFSEPPVDDLTEETFPVADDERVFAVEYLPGQFDQRADSAEACVKLLGERGDVRIRTATVYVCRGGLSDEEIGRIESYVINPVDSRLASLEKADTLKRRYEQPADVRVFDHFRALSEEKLRSLYESLNLAMTFRDFQFIQTYYLQEAHRDPTVTEIRVLDTYWSDHCRHTTFATELRTISIEDGRYKKPIEDTLRQYLSDRRAVYGDRKDKYVCLMDLATMGARVLKKEGRLSDQEDTDEINACSIVVPVKIDGKTEEWLVNFKNETHNHPTEIEPFGGAATCLGGAIRDPLSGRTYVYQAMRITGAADPRQPIGETMNGKLPQKKLVREAAHGYSSYGNQIGLATGYVKEFYHPNYVAKRMELGAVMAAAPRKNVLRADSRPGDVIILLGGRTGRDGIGGATGSSKAHNAQSIEVCGAEVQKGNAPTERKLQRMFRRPEVSKLIRKCNDFGAGGVSVAIGELAAGLVIDLDKVPKKYAGLDGTEIAISESQERMAVVIDPKDEPAFMKYAAEENLEATEVAKVTEEPRLVMNWRGKTIVDIERAFLDTNGAHQETDARIEEPDEQARFFEKRPIDEAEVRDRWLRSLSDLNGCSQKGLVEMFDSSIGAGTVLMPYGGKYQLTETQSMVAKLPVLKGTCDTVTMMAAGFDPWLSSWSPYHGAQYAVLESVARIVAGGGDWKKIHFTFQEYFRRMSTDPERWSQPLAALLGAYAAQRGFGLASIGGKDSMSGTFDDIDVPPTLVSFAVDVNELGNIISPELKKAGSKLVLIQVPRDSYDLPDYEAAKEQYGRFFEDVKAGRVISAYAIDRMGVAAALSKMAFGNHLGFRIEHSVAPEDLFFPDFGAIVAEVPDGKVSELQTAYTMVGVVTDDRKLSYRSITIPVEEAISSWTGTLEQVFHSHPGRPEESAEAPEKLPICEVSQISVCTHHFAQPNVFIPVFPGTNCEYDSAKAFDAAGANTDVKVLRSRTAEEISESIDEFAASIDKAQILMFPGGFSAGDEPDGSAKFFATAFRNEKLKEAVTRLLNERDGLILGICNGFQALIKLGLVPYGGIVGQKEDSPTLTFNTIHRHISRMVYTKVVSKKSPWLSRAEVGGVYVNPASHGEGRFVADEAWVRKLLENGQAATMYCTPEGTVTSDSEWNVNGSVCCIEGITSPDGRIFGKMAHVERRGDGVAINISGEQDMKVFESGVDYFRV